jgi:hypothetical protein
MLNMIVYTPLINNGGLVNNARKSYIWSEWEKSIAVTKISFSLTITLRLARSPGQLRLAACLELVDQ